MVMGQLENISVFIVEDHPEDLLTLQMMLADVKGNRYAFQHSPQLADAVQQMSRSFPHIILLSLNLENQASIAPLQEIHEKFPFLPVVVMTHRENQDLAAEALRLGAQDFLIKGKLDGHLLSRVITYAMERHRVMEEMRQKNQELERLNSLKTEFVSAVSHELRTPLTILISATNNLLDGAYGKLSDSQKKWMKKIEFQGMKLLTMISELLDLSKLQSGTADWKKKIVNISYLVLETVHHLQPVAHEKQIDLACQVDGRQPSVMGDQLRLEQVINNLITNAFKFTPAGGKVHVDVVSDRSHVTVSVSDTGPGIAAENQALIFEKFRQVRSSGDEEGPSTKGIGLGLAICKEIIEHYEGKIWVESSLGHGSRFLFSLPLQKSAAKEKKQVA